MPKPPIADQRPHAFTHHGITVQDPYHWLKDQSYPKVDDEDILAYLNAENEYSEHNLAPLQPKIEAMFLEMKGRLDLRDESVPVKLGNFLYQSRYDGEAQYRTHLRWPVGLENPSDSEKQVILDTADLAEEYDYFRLGDFSISQHERLLAYATDTNGSERFTIQIRDLDSGVLLDDTVRETIGSIVWSSDNKGFFYQAVDEHWRPDRVKYHLLGTDPAQDPEIYHESDPAFFVEMNASRSREFLLISAGTHVTSEVRFLPLSDVNEKPILISERTQDHEYSVDHCGDLFFILTNDTHKNFRLVKTSVSKPEPENWESVIEGSDDRYLRGHSCFEFGVVLALREQGLAQVEILGLDGNIVRVPFEEPIYHAYPFDNPEFKTPSLRLQFTSLVTPDTVYDYALEERTLQLRKVRSIPSGYDRSLYTSDRLWITARDGVSVPVSMVYRRDVNTQEAPLYLYGYGAYGHASEPRFSTTRLSLLDRGYVFAIAHIRGGNELGYHWYEAGKLERRTNTFNDFVDVARGLIELGYSRPGKIAIAGGSAGGELVGAAVNLAPELWGSAVLRVPFVDVLNTMLDESLPLTPIEWPEWGNPITDKQAFEYIQSYSPYDQLAPIVYPPMLVTAGLNDPRVTYWEPAKYVAKLRSLNQGDNLILLKTEMGAGHGGKSGRFDFMREVAEEYVFIDSTLSTLHDAASP